MHIFFTTSAWAPFAHAKPLPGRTFAGPLTFQGAATAHKSPTRASGVGAAYGHSLLTIGSKTLATICFKTK